MRSFSLSIVSCFVAAVSVATHAADAAVTTPDPTKACPRFLDCVAKACRTFAALKPDFYMVDDDTRIVFGDAPQLPAVFRVKVSRVPGGGTL